MIFDNLVLAVKKSKIGYYVKNLYRQLIPRVVYPAVLQKKLSVLYSYDKAAIEDRVDYYNKLVKPVVLGNNAIELHDMPIFKSPKTYNFDTFEYTRYFNKDLKANFLFGDVSHAEPVPTIQKSRPVTNNENAVLLKLDKKRHFVFVKDRIAFADKRDILMGRGGITQPHRIKFMEMYFNDPLCDLGQVNLKGGNPKWIKPGISVFQHLKYKFILSLEGNDVATNLKWIMSSNSIAVMPRPKYETWFMEGRLIPNHHYICIKDDYTDLHQQLEYYISHPQKAGEIISNANAYTKQFLNKQQEDLIALLVLQKYFYCTSQIGDYALLNG